MSDSCKEERLLEVQEELAVASLGGKPVSKAELKKAEDYVDGRIDRDAFEREADTMEAVREEIDSSH